MFASDYAVKNFACVIVSEDCIGVIKFLGDFAHFKFKFFWKHFKNIGGKSVRFSKHNIEVGGGHVACVNRIVAHIFRHGVSKKEEACRKRIVEGVTLCESFAV